MTAGLEPAFKNLEARVGFEPTNDGFADHSLRPLGYRASVYIMPKICPQSYAQRTLVFADCPLEPMDTSWREKRGFAAPLPGAAWVPPKIVIITKLGNPLGRPSLVASDKNA